MHHGGKELTLLEPGSGKAIYRAVRVIPAFLIFLFANYNFLRPPNQYFGGKTLRKSP